MRERCPFFCLPLLPGAPGSGEVTVLMYLLGVLGLPLGQLLVLELVQISGFHVHGRIEKSLH